jgi:hypothetical protein
MSKGGYIGGHTKIFLSEDGTLWPDGADPVAKTTKRWGSDGVELVGPHERKRFVAQSGKTAELKFLAAMAAAYRNRETVKTLPRLPQGLRPYVEAAGGLASRVDQFRGQAALALLALRRRTGKAVAHTDVRRVSGWAVCEEEGAKALIYASVPASLESSQNSRGPVQADSVMRGLDNGSRS